MGNIDPTIQENKAFEADGGPVSKLLSSLRRVEATGDFDTRVRARIAKGRPSAGRLVLIPASLRYAVPLVLLLAIGGYFAINSFYTAGSADVPAVADVRPADAPPIATSPLDQGATIDTNQTRAELVEVKQPDPAAKDNSSAPGKTPVPDTSRSQLPGGGSIDEAGSESRHILRRGFELESHPIANSNVSQSRPISPKDVFEFFGIKAAYDGSGWKVESVEANNIGDRSGVRAGDVIEAVDDRKLTDKTSFGSKFTGRSIRVRRGTETLKIDLIK